MKKQYKIMLGFVLVILLIGISTAGILSTWNDTIDLNSTQDARIKNSTGITSIDVTISTIQCNEKQCWARIEQDKLIHTEWRGSKDYCSSFNQTIINNESNQIDGVCIGYTDYTIQELEDFVSAYVEKRLSNWADAEEIRKTRTIEVITNEGTITKK